MSAIPAVAFPFSASVIERLGWTLLHSLWQFALVALLVSTILAALRRSSATLRYGVLVAAMTVSAAVPIATWMILPIASDYFTRGALAAPRRLDPTAGPPIDPARRIDRPPLPDDSFTRIPPDAGPTYSAPGTLHDSVARDVRDTKRVAPSLWPRLQSSLRPWFAWIVAGWSIGVVVCSLRPCWGGVPFGVCGG